jgi:DNA-binding XRE family transcriptional regulator
MHWIQTLREHLQITQEELGHYLQLSINTIKSVEVGRRSLPPESLIAAAALFEAIKNAQVTRVAINSHAPASHHHTRRAKQMHRQCCRKLDRSIDNLDKMKKSHTTACFALGVYQVLAQSLPTPVSKEEQARLLWAQRQINDTLQRINDTSPAAQNLLAAEIVGLKNVVHSLDLIQLNSEHNTPITKGPEPISL